MLFNAHKLSFRTFLKVVYIVCLLRAFSCLYVYNHRVDFVNLVNPYESLPAASDSVVFIFTGFRKNQGRSLQHVEMSPNVHLKTFACCQIGVVSLDLVFRKGTCRELLKNMYEFLALCRKHVFLFIFFVIYSYQINQCLNNTNDER